MRAGSGRREGQGVKATEARPKPLAFTLRPYHQVGRALTCNPLASLTCPILLSTIPTPPASPSRPSHPHLCCLDASPLLPAAPFSHPHMSLLPQTLPLTPPHVMYAGGRFPQQGVLLAPTPTPLASASRPSHPLPLAFTTMSCLQKDAPSARCPAPPSLALTLLPSHPGVRFGYGS